MSVCVCVCVCVRACMRVWMCGGGGGRGSGRRCICVWRCGEQGVVAQVSVSTKKTILRRWFFKINLHFLAFPY